MRRAGLALLITFAIASSQTLTTPIADGIAAFRRKNYPAAEAAFQRAIRVSPASSRAYKLLGMVYGTQERYEEAVAPFEKACALDPKEEEACYLLGRTYYHLSRLEESRRALEKALSYSDDPARRGLPLLGLAMTVEAMGGSEGAEALYKRAIATGEARAMVDYGTFLFRQGRREESVQMLRQAAARTEEGKPELERVLKALRNSPELKTQPATNVKFESSELNIVVRNGATGKKHLIETVIGGVAVFDYDNDNWPDIYVANGAEIPSLRKTSASFHNRLFRNNHDGTFVDVTDKSGVAGRGYSMGVAAADYDNDGWVDLLVTGVSGVTLYRNRGDGAFDDATERAGLGNIDGWSVAAGWFDFDNDGHLDLLVVRYVVWDPARETECGFHKEGYRSYCHPRNYEPLPNALFRNRGNGTFQDASAESGIADLRGKGMSVAFGDYDGDGRLDAFVTNDNMPNFLFHNEGNGTFRDRALEAGVAYNDGGKAISAMGLDFRDYDNDGREDIFITALSNETFPLFRNIGKAQFADMSELSRIAISSLPWTGWGTGMYDLNNDGRKDIFVAGGHVMDNAELTSSRKSRQPNLVYVNEGGGKFRALTLAGESFHRGAAFGDFDRDGRIDIVVTRLNEKPILLRNVTSGGHWLALRLVGRKSNRDGIGARVHIAAANSEQWNRVTTSVGYASSSDRIVHFGLGKDATVSMVEIEWPSGLLQKVFTVDADRLVIIEESTH